MTDRKKKSMGVVRVARRCDDGRLDVLPEPASFPGQDAAEKWVRTQTEAGRWVILRHVMELQIDRVERVEITIAQLPLGI